MVTRRGVLLGGLAGAAALAVTGKLALPPSEQADPISDAQIDKAAQALDSYLTKEKPHYLFLGDTKHKKMSENYRVLGHPSMVEVFVKHGFLDAAFEVRHEQQALVEKLKNKEISLEEYKDEVNRQWRDAGDTLSPTAEMDATTLERGKAFTRMHDAGMVPHMVEAQAADLSEHLDIIRDVASADQAMSEEIGAHTGLTGIFKNSVRNVLRNIGVISSDTYARTKVQAREDAEEEIKDSFGARMEKNVQAARIAGDAKLSEDIIVRTDGRPAVVFYGSGHYSLDSENSLKARLAGTGKKVSTVALLLGVDAHAALSQTEANRPATADAYLDVRAGKMHLAADDNEKAMCVKQNTRRSLFIPSCER